MSGSVAGLGDRGRVGLGLVLGDRQRPGVRTVLGGLLAQAETVDLAVSRVRLAAIDFHADDLAALHRCRVVVSGFDNGALIDAVDAAARVPSLARNLAVLRTFIDSGRLEIRSAGACRWSPDFCLAVGPLLRPWFRDGAAALVGHLGLGASHPDGGPRLTCLLSGWQSAASVEDGFLRVWSRGHDVIGVVAETLDRFRLRAS